MSIKLHYFSADNSIRVHVNRFNKIMAQCSSHLCYFTVGLYHGQRKLSTSDRFQLHEKESVSYPNRYIRFPLEDLSIADVILKLKVKRWSTFLWDVKLCEIVFSADSRGRPGEHWKRILEEPDTTIQLWHEGKRGGQWLVGRCHVTSVLASDWLKGQEMWRVTGYNYCISAYFKSHSAFNAEQTFVSFLSIRINRVIFDNLHQELTCYSLVLGQFTVNFITHFGIFS